MFETGLEIIVFVLLILIFVWYFYWFMSNKKSENFDTFYDHDDKAYYVYKEKYPDIGMFETVLKDKYQWSEKDKAGLTIYDKVYENILTEDHDQLNVQTAYNFGDFTGMYSTQQNADFGGYNITLMQKNY